MKFMVYVLVFFIISCYAQEDETECKTSKDESGKCVSIVNCEPFIEILRLRNKTNDDIEYLRRSQCSGFEGNYPLVCCPARGRGLARGLPGSPLPRPTECGVTNVTSSMRVVGGVPAKLGEFPWVVALGYRNQRNPSQPRWMCGGTLISSRHVLTAAHCVHNRDDFYLVRLGELDLYSDEDGASPIDLRVSGIKIHEQFSATTFTDDIALLTLIREVDISGPLVRPVCLPTDEPFRSRDYTNTSPYVAGWGSIYFNGPSSPVLQVVMLPVVPNAQCQSAFKSLTVVDDRVMCAGYQEGGKDSCRGDSGGPFMFETDDLVTYQIGVISYGIACAQPGLPSVQTRVTHYLDWIVNNMN